MNKISLLINSSVLVHLTTQQSHSLMSTDTVLFRFVRHKYVYVMICMASEKEPNSKFRYLPWKSLVGWAYCLESAGAPSRTPSHCFRS